MLVSLTVPLAPVDLLRGGAIGLGGATSRHHAEGSIAASGREVGVRLNGTWRSHATLNAGTPLATTQLQFSGHSTFDLRAFADLGQLIGGPTFLQKTRLSLGVVNIANARPRVTDMVAPPVMQREQPHRCCVVR